MRFLSNLLSVFVHRTFFRILGPFLLLWGLASALTTQPPFLILLAIPLLGDHVYSQYGRFSETAMRAHNQALSQLRSGTGSLDALLNSLAPLTGTSGSPPSARRLFWTHDVPWALKVFALGWIVAVALCWLASYLFDLHLDQPFATPAVAVLVLSHVLRSLSLAAPI